MSESRVPSPRILVHLMAILNLRDSAPSAASGAQSLLPLLSPSANSIEKNNLLPAAFWDLS